MAGRQMMKGARYAAKNEAVREIANQALQKGTEIAATAAVDALQGRNFGSALKKRSREAALNALTGSSNNTNTNIKRKRVKLKQKGNAAKETNLLSSIIEKKSCEEVY